MDEQVIRALAQDQTIDITTNGRKTGQPHRIEIRFHNVGGHVYIAGTPGRRDWYANLLAHPDFIFHLKGTTRADLSARATPIIDPARRREVMGQIVRNTDWANDLDKWVLGSPLVEVTFTD